MAFPDDTSYPTYPGLGPWRLAAYERYTEDYALSGATVPFTSEATKLDIFSSLMPADGWLGTVIPLPSVLLLGIPYTTIVDMICRYRYWMEYGQCMLVSTQTQSGYTLGRAPTFDYQYRDQYKEVVHYGFHMILLGLVHPTGKVQILRVDSISPWLEHRHQCTFQRYLVSQGTISSAKETADSAMVVLTPDYGVPLALQAAPDISGMGILLYWHRQVAADAVSGTPASVEYHATQHRVTGMDANGDFRIPLPKGEFDPTVAEMTGAFYRLNRKTASGVVDASIQVEDPSTLFSEVQTSSGYYFSRPLGYETSEQQVEQAADTYSSLLFQPGLVSPSIHAKALQELTISLQSKDTAEVTKAINRFIHYAAEEKAVLAQPEVAGGLSEATKGKSVEVTLPPYEELVKQYMTAAQTASAKTSAAVVRSLGDPLATVSSNTAEGSTWSVPLDLVVIRESQTSGTMTLKLSITGATLSRHNFHAGTQVGNFLIANHYFPGGMDIHAYKILVHDRNGIYTVSTQSSSSGVGLVELLASVSVPKFSIRSYRFWKTNDITTNSGAVIPSNPSLIEGLLPGKIVWQQEAVGEEQPMADCVLKISDSSYYNMTNPKDVFRIRSHFLDDAAPPADGGIVKAWKKCYGWRLNSSSDSSVSYQIDSVDPVLGTDGRLSMQVVATPGTISEDTTWWISFAPKLDVTPPFSYISTPFLALTAQYTFDQTTVPPTGAIMFTGMYVSAPNIFDIPTGSALSLVEDNPAAFANAGQPQNSLIWVSSARQFEYMSFYYDKYLNAQYLLYSRGDDQSRALCIRRGRLDFMSDITEFMAYYGDVEKKPCKISGTYDQLISISSSSVSGRSVIAIEAARRDPAKAPNPPGGGFGETMWTVYQGRRLLGYRSASGLESTEATRLTTNQPQKVSSIPFYQKAKYWIGPAPARHQVPGNRQTGDPLAGDGTQFRFMPVPAAKGDIPASLMAENSSVLVVPDTNVLKSGKGQFFFVTGNRGSERLALLVVQPQLEYVAGGDAGGEYVLVPGTGNDQAPPLDKSGVNLASDGVFLFSSSNELADFSGGLFAIPQTLPAAGMISRASLYRFPYLLMPNLTTVSFDSLDGEVYAAGYTSMAGKNGDKTLVLAAAKSDLVGCTSGAQFCYTVGGQPMFALPRPTVPFPVLRQSAVEGVSGVVDASLSVEPVGVAADKGAVVIIYRSKNDTDLVYAISTSGGKNWAVYDDIVLVRGKPRATSPSVRVVGGELWIFYIQGGTELMFKKVSLSLVMQFQTRYNGGQSSSEQDPAIEKKKQELQTVLDNISSRKLADTFDQQVSFSVTSQMRVTVAYFDSSSRIVVSASTTNGETWDSTPVNF